MFKSVPNLEPNDPKILPLIPIAPGTKVNKPGQAAK